MSDMDERIERRRLNDKQRRCLRTLAALPEADRWSVAVGEAMGMGWREAASTMGGLLIKLYRHGYLTRCALNTGKSRRIVYTLSALGDAHLKGLETDAKVEG